VKFQEYKNLPQMTQISPAQPHASPSAAAITAGKLVLEQIHQFANKGVDFAFETTLSGKLYVNLFKSLKEKGHTIHPFFLSIPEANLAVSRIKSRVAQGGHDIPVQDVVRQCRGNSDIDRGGQTWYSEDYQ
jgi:predicted ABC-type ATPase